MKREKDPNYLQDTVLPKESEKTHKSWDLDREFGPGTEAKSIRVLDGYLKNFFSSHDDVPSENLRGPWSAADYFILTGHQFGSSSERQRIIDVLKHEIEKSLREDRNLNAAWNAVRYAALTGEQFIVPDDPQGLASKRLLEAFTDAVSHSIQTNRNDHKVRAAWDAADFRILTGHQFGTFDDREDFLDTLTQSIRERLKQKEFRLVPSEVVSLRLLRAHDLKFTPGKGIEIIDDPPAEFEKKQEPLPEERKF